MENTKIFTEYIAVERDAEAMAARIRVSSGKISKTIPVSSQCLIDIDENQRILNIELLGPSAEMIAARRPSLAIDLTKASATYSALAISAPTNVKTVLGADISNDVAVS